MRPFSSDRTLVDPIEPGHRDRSLSSRRRRKQDERELVERIRQLERVVHELTPAASMPHGEVPCWVVDPAWTELRELNPAAQALLHIAPPATAADLLSRIDHRDHDLLGEVTPNGGHLPMVHVVRPDGETRVIACTAVPRRGSSGTVVDVAFLAWDVTTEAAAVRDSELAARLARLGLHADPGDLWRVVARELRRGCRARSVAVIERGQTDTPLAADPPDHPLVSIDLLPSSLDETRALTEWTLATPVGTAGGSIVVLVDGATAAGALLGDGTSTHAVLDGLADRHLIDRHRTDQLRATSEAAEQLRLVTAERDAAREAAAVAEAARASAHALAESTSAQLADLSHELSNALNSVCGFAQVLARQPMEEQQARAMQHILLAGRHLSSLLDRVLEIARVDARPLTDELVALDLPAVVAESVALVQSAADERGVRIETSVDVPSPRGDAGAVRQVLLNLLSNAVKYGHAGGVVRVRAERVGPVVRVEVVDHGPGIPDERQRGLFERFDRGGLEPDDRRGTGLGLALCRRLVESMDGSIGVRSELGAGSTFWFELPVARDRSGAVVASVVVAVPDSATLELVDFALATLPDVEVVPVRTASAGAEAVRRARPRVLITDFDLADVDELVTRTRTASPGTTIVALTAGRDAVRRAGVNVELHKPCSVDDLVATVVRGIEERS